MKEFEKILIIKNFIPHIKYDWEDYSVMGYTDLKLGQYNEIKENAERIKQTKLNNKIRQDEIKQLLKSELFSDNKRIQLINEYNDLSFASVITDTEIIAESLELLLYVCRYYDYIIIHELGYKYFRIQLGAKDVNFTIEEINKLVYMMKRYIKEEWSFDSVWIVYNALLLHEYSSYWDDYYEACTEINKVHPNEMNSLIDYLNKIKKPHGFTWNIYSLFKRMIEDVDLDLFIQYYPLTKDYYSSIKTIKKLKSNEDVYSMCKKDDDKENKIYTVDNKLTDIGSSTFLMEVGGQFSESILFGISVKLFSIMEYDTGIDTSELLFSFLNDISIKNNTKDHLTLIKGGRINDK